MDSNPVRRERKKKKLTQIQLAKLADVNVDSVRRIEKNLDTATVQLLKKVAKAPRIKLKDSFNIFM